MKSGLFISLFFSSFLFSCSYNTPKIEKKAFKKYSEQEFAIFLDTILNFQQQQDLVFQEKIHFKEVFEDLQVLKHILEEACTPLYRYSSKNKIDSLFSSFIQNQTDSISYFEFSKNLALLFSEIGCMHSGWGHSESYKIKRNSDFKFLPLEFVIVDHELFIAKNYSRDTSILVGSQVLQINKQSSTQVIKQLGKFMTSDTHNLAIKEKAISDYFPMAYSNFIGKPDSFEIEILKDLKQETKKIVAIKRVEIDSLKKVRYPVKKQINQGLLNLEINKKTGLAKYQIKSFNNNALAHFGQNFITFTDSVFKEIGKQGIQKLIIDIRGNNGGWTANGKELFSYFIDDSVAYIESVYSKKQSNFSFQKIISNHPGYSDTMEFKNGYWSNYFNLMAFPKKNSFHGKTIVLVDENSKSCSSIFSTLMSEHKKAVFIGSETGGAHCGSNGMTISIKLPHSKTGITFSTALYKTAVQNPKRSGVIPDYPLKSDLNSILSEKDPILEFAEWKINEPLNPNP